MTRLADGVADSYLLDVPDWVGVGFVENGSGQSRSVAREHSADLPAGAKSRRRRSFAVGRHAARDALRAVSLPVSPIRIGPDGRPLWPDGVVGSISHSGDRGLAMVAPSALTDGIGVDIEVVRGAPEIAELVALPDELLWLRQSEDPELDLLRLFSAKECIFKAFSPRVGRWFGFEAATLRPTDGGFEARLLERLDADYPADRSFQLKSIVIAQFLVSWLILPKTPTNSSQGRG